MIVTKELTAPGGGCAGMSSDRTRSQKPVSTLASSRLFQCADQFGKPVDLMRTEDQIQIRDPLKEPVAPLLGQATADTDDQLGFFFLQLPETSQPTVYLLCRFFPDAARVYDDQVRPFRIIRCLVSRLLKQGRHLLRILNVHLAAKSLNIELFFLQAVPSILKHHKKCNIIWRGDSQYLFMTIFFWQLTKW